MRTSAFLIFTAGLITACGGSKEKPFEALPPCNGLNIALLDRAVAPPANVAVLTRITDCDGRALGVRLDEEAFDLSENGALLSRYEADRAVIAADRDKAQRTVIALDLSGSIVRSGVKPLMIEGARQLVREAAPDHQIAIFGFDGRPDLIRFSYFTDDIEALDAALNDVLEAPIVDDSTNLHGAVINALTVLNRAVEIEDRDLYTVAQGALVIFTDGTDRAGRIQENEVRFALDETLHATFAIGIGSELDEEVLEAIGRTGHVLVGDSGSIVEAFESVARDLKARAMAEYVISYCSPARAGDRELEIAARHGSLFGSLRISFNANGFGAGCSPDDSPLK